MLAIGADIIRNEIIVSDSISLLRMVPEPTRILDPLTVMVDQHVINRDPPVSALQHSKIGRAIVAWTPRSGRYGPGRPGLSG